MIIFMCKIPQICITNRHLVTGDFLEQLRYVAGFHPEKIILREKDLDAIEPLMRTHLYGGVSRMGSKIYSDEYRGYFKLPEGK